jgi:uncharacterized protein (TIGR03067 family)
MQGRRFLQSATGLAGLILLLAVPAGRADIVTPVKSWTGQLEDVGLEKEAPRGNVIGNKEDFAALWKTWMSKEKLPEINFDKEFVAVMTSRTFAANSIVMSVEKGNAHPILAGMPRKNDTEKIKEIKGFVFVIGVFSREMFKTVNGNALPGPTLADDLRREMRDLRARIATLERQVAEPELKKLEGTWKVTSVINEGAEVPEKQLENLKVAIAGDQVTIKIEGKDEMLRLTIDPTRKPVTVDLCPEDKTDEAVKGIYQLDKDTLKVCFTQPGSERPREIDSKKGDRSVLITLRREQK